MPPTARIRECGGRRRATTSAGGRSLEKTCSSAGIPWKFHDRAFAITKPAPCIGEHNEYAVTELLGRDRAEYERLLADRVLLTEPAAP